MKILSFILIVLFTLSISKKLKTTTRCINLGDDCDFTSFCCGSWVCKDYKCAVKGTKDNQEEWAPKGDKCDWFHHCRKYYHCESHYCVISQNKVIKDVEKTIKKEFI